ncbi:MAG TPA: hypothetical protein VK762_05455 [Polyangiaceae bacterium]|jgi:hypothetical protein|nr:hypothetical protein [Polyangiaceae bacterium]
MNMSVVNRLSAACVAIAALTASVNASASSTHYYAILWNPNDNSGNPNTGAAVNIRTDILHSTCNIATHNFVNHEFWYGVTDGGAYWVEVGFKDGLDIGGGCQTQIDFWADNRNGGGYNEHYPNNGWSLGTFYTAEVINSGSCAWNVLLGGLNIGTSTSNCQGTGRYLAGGLESTSQTTGSAKGFLSNWQTFNNTWKGGWDGSSTTENGQPFIEFLNNNSETEETLNESF